MRLRRGRAPRWSVARSALGRHGQAVSHQNGRTRHRCDGYRRVTDALTLATLRCGADASRGGGGRPVSGGGGPRHPRSTGAGLMTGGRPGGCQWTTTGRVLAYRRYRIGSGAGAATPHASRLGRHGPHTRRESARRPAKGDEGQRLRPVLTGSGGPRRRTRGLRRWATRESGRASPAGRCSVRVHPAVDGAAGSAGTVDSPAGGDERAPPHALR